ncbi:MAG: radical SAM protein [Verrucomicrobiota bacterium]|nr:radical SAM protein [Verrucomicrobiota bacterium]
MVADAVEVGVVAVVGAVEVVEETSISTRMTEPISALQPTSTCASYRPKGMLLQWHLTNRCNLRCEHCYQESYGGDELNFEELIGVLGQYEKMIQSWRHQSGKSFHAQITLTGGEPFVRKDFPRFLMEIAKRRSLFSFAILTNGSMIDRPMARQLRSLRPKFVQVSIEGTEDTHDRIRGCGDYQRTISAIRLLRRFGVKTLISFTAHRENYREFTDVARLGIRLGVDRVWSDRLIPNCSNATKSSVATLDAVETREFFQIMADARIEARHRWFCRTEIAMHRALQFLVGGGTPYSCKAGDSLLTIMPNGDVLPCRRMPIPVGNLRQAGLHEIYSANLLLQQLRNPQQIVRGCENCSLAPQCRGGLKCLASATSGNPFDRDPGCWMPTDNLGLESASISTST